MFLFIFIWLACLNVEERKKSSEEKFHPYWGPRTILRFLTAYWVICRRAGSTSGFDFISPQTMSSKMEGSDALFLVRVLHVHLKFAKHCDKCIKYFLPIKSSGQFIQVGTLYCIFVDVETEVQIRFIRLFSIGLLLLSCHII